MGTLRCTTSTAFRYSSDSDEKPLHVVRSTSHLPARPPHDRLQRLLLAQHLDVLPLRSPDVQRVVLDHVLAGVVGVGDGPIPTGPASTTGVVGRVSSMTES